MHRYFFGILGFMSQKGHHHPISILIREINAIFSEMGFELAQGPEIERERYNFDALNVPADHPARDMQDTFFLKNRKEVVLRTHTSPVQIRYMEQNEPPIRIIVPGKVFRNEATDATHEAQFYQIEGLMVDKDVTLANLKATLLEFLTKVFGDNTTIRFRPSFFPFVEPGVEVDLSCFRCDGAGCSVCKYTGWIEILGAGMVHPNVLQGAGIHPKKYQGFAFGVGIDRIAMLRYGITDIRLLYSGDLRLVNQF